MRSSFSRLFLCAAGAALIGLSGQAGAAAAPPGPKPLVIKDDIGDSAADQASLDIAEVVVTTSGKVIKVGKKQVYTPDALVFTMKLAAAPTPLPVGLYEIRAVTSRCGNLWLYFDAQDLFSGGQVDCGDPPDAKGDTTHGFEAGPVVSGNSIVWTIPFTDLPKEMKVGTTITDFHSYVAIGEPAEGISTEVLLASANADNADASDTYKIG